MIEGSGDGSVHRANGSESGRPNSTRIRIPNPAKKDPKPAGLLKPTKENHNLRKKKKDFKDFMVWSHSMFSLETEIFCSLIALHRGLQKKSIEFF